MIWRVDRQDSVEVFSSRFQFSIIFSSISGLSCKYRAFHNVLRDCEHLLQENRRTCIYETCSDRRNNSIPPSKLLFIAVHISAARRWECMQWCLWCLCKQKSSGRPLTAEYRIDVCRVTRGAHIEHLQLSKKKKKLFQFSRGCEQFHYGRFFGFLVINICNYGVHYEAPCTCRLLVKKQSVQFWFVYQFRFHLVTRLQVCAGVQVQCVFAVGPTFQVAEAIRYHGGQCLQFLFCLATVSPICTYDPLSKPESCVGFQHVLSRG